MTALRHVVRLAASFCERGKTSARKSSRLNGILCLLAMAAGASAADPEPARPTVIVDTVSGKSLKGRLDELRADWSVRVGRERVDVGEMIALRRQGVSRPPVPSGEHIVFANGDRLPGRIGEMGGNRLTVERGSEKLEVPLTSLAAVWFATPDGADPDRLRRRLAAQSRTQDVVLLRNGDTVEGSLRTLDGRTLRLDVNNKELTIERSKVAVLALNTDLVTTPKASGASGRLVLRDGTRLSLTSASCKDGETLSGETPFRLAVRFPIEDVVALDILGGPAVYLSELKAKKYEHVPYLGAAWPYVVDGSVDRRDLRLGGSTFDRGIGMHTESRLTYDLGGRYRRFEALVGLDDRTGKGGTARIRVLVDGKPKDIGDAELTGHGEPRAIRVDVSGAKELTIVAEFGERGGVQGHVDWAEARLIK